MYLLDTDTVSFAIRGVGDVGTRLRAEEPSQIAVSVITEAELWFGVRKLGSKRLERAVVAFFADTMIAAHALTTKRVLVTSNRRHFVRVPGLRTADWRS